ncbi:hypothetical protein GCM10027259_42100 [Micromonospora palomenae]
MLPVAWLISALLPTMAMPLVIISTAPKITVRRAQSGSLRLVRFLAPPVRRPLRPPWDGIVVDARAWGSESSDVGRGLV